MNYNFSAITTASATSSIALRTVYVLDADTTYDVRKSKVPYMDLIALRTTEGMGKVKIEGFPEMTVLPGTLMLFKHTDVRRYYCSGEKWRFWWFEFSSDEMLNIPLNTLLQVKAVENEQDNCISCLELLRKNQTESNYLASAFLSLLLYKWKLNLENKTNTNPHGYNLQKAIAHMRLNPCDNISVKELADIAGLCERRFRQLFKSNFGMPPKKYFDSLRISMAEELLRNTPFCVNEISERLGYSNQFHFSKAFQKCFHMPPSQYRKKKLGNLS